jgi:hypothetical protein
MESPAEWEEIWLTEGIATWTEFLWVEAWSPSVLPQLMASREASWMGYDDEVARYALYAPPSGRLFGSTIYQKGGWVVAMLRYVVGDEAFFTGIRNYLESHAGGNGRSGELRAAMEEASGMDLSAFFDEWVYGVGYPKYSTSWRSQPATAGRYQVDVRVRQLQQSPTIFTTPLEVEVIGTGGERARQRIAVTGGDSTGSVCVDFVPSSIVVDPDNRILGTVSAGTAAVTAQPIVCGGDEPPPPPGPGIAITSIAWVKTGKNAGYLQVGGDGFLVDDSIVEVNGAALRKTKYPKRYRGDENTTTVLYGQQKKLGRDVVQVGVPVQVTILNSSTGLRSAPVTFTRTN